MLLFTLPACAQAPVLEWDRTLGGSGFEWLYQARQTADGGYILAGQSESGISADKSQANRGSLTTKDYWVVKLDAAGRKQWDQTIGGSDEDRLFSLQLTRDGGYILGGHSRSPVSGDKTQPLRGYADYWLVKLSAQGTKEWDRTYGGSGSDQLEEVYPTADGGYILGGISDSPVSGDKTESSRGGEDYWAVKVDAMGTKQWDRTLGGSGHDALRCIIQTAEGGYLLGGYTYSNISGEKSQPNKGRPYTYDYWIVKLNATGQLQWDRTLGGEDEDRLDDLRQTADGGYILGGTSNSDISGDKSQPNRGGDYWLVKVDATGTKQWDRSLGGPGFDYFGALTLTSDGGYLVGGQSRSGIGGDKTEPGRGNSDAWVLKLDAVGQVQWDRTLGGSDYDDLFALEPTRDGGYLLGGNSESSVSGEKSEPSRNSRDYWVVKLAPPTIQGNTQLCGGGSVPLTAPAGAVAYAWNTGATGATIHVQQPGTYQVLCTYANGTQLTLTKTVQAFSPVATLTGDSVLCAGQSGLLRVQTSQASAYMWNTGATTPTIAITQAGAYWVDIFYGSGCQVRREQQVQVGVVVPAFSLGPDTVLCEGQELLLQAPSTVGPSVRYRWSDGSTGTSLRVREPGEYRLDVSRCGTQSAVRRVQYRPCLMVPNIITPNGDGLNDQFYIAGLVGPNWQLRIYDRWGKQVYATEAYHNDWGPAATPGVYYYLLRRSAAEAPYKGWLQVAP